MTLHEQLQQYATRPDAVHFSKRKIKLLGFFLSRVYDKVNKGREVAYVQVQEGGRTYTVRDYPDRFVPVINTWILRFHRHIKFGHPLNPPQKKPAARRKTISSTKKGRNEKK